MRCILGVLVLVAACGGEAVPQARPADVPVELVPEALEGASITVHRNDDDETTEVFASLGERSLVADVALWELRQRERLVGALQITTVTPKVDLTRGPQRESIRRQILPSTAELVVVSGVPVFATSADDKVVYLWFGRDHYQVLQLKGSRLEPEAVLTELLTHETGLKAWEGLPPEVYEEDVQ